MKPKLGKKKALEPIALASSRLSVRWGRKETDGWCNVCRPTDPGGQSRWVAVLRVRESVTFMCPTHLRELQQIIDNMNNPPAARHILEKEGIIKPKA